MNVTMTIVADSTIELLSAIKEAAAKIKIDDTEKEPAAFATPALNHTTPAPVAAPANTAPQGAPPAPVTLGPAQIPMPPVGPMAPAAPTMPPVQQVPLTTAPTYSLDQIAKAGAELAQAGKMNDLLALLQQFGIQAVTQLKPEQIGPFATALRGMGAQL